MTNGINFMITPVSYPEINEQLSKQTVLNRITNWFFLHLFLAENVISFRNKIIFVIALELTFKEDSHIV